MKDIMEIQQSRIQESALDCRFTGWRPGLSETRAALLQVFMKAIFFLTLIPLIPYPTQEHETGIFHIQVLV